jgi:ankyrin repeat protein
VQQNHYHIVQLLVEHGAQVNICYTPPPQQQQQKSSLLTTTSSNNLFSASPIAMPTPLLVACSLGHTDIVQYLLQNGASVATEDNGGNTALMTCCEQGHLQTAMFLIAYFKDSAKQQINKKSMTFHLWTCLHFAASAGHTQIVRLLLDNGAFVDALDDIGRTPLHHASARGHPEVVMLLIERGANVEIKDDQFGREDGGKTALDLATESIHYHRVSRAFKEALAKRQHGSLLTADNVSNGSYNNQPHPVFFQSSPLSFKSRNLLRTRLHSRTPSADRSDFFKNSSQQQV